MTVVEPSRRVTSGGLPEAMLTPSTWPGYAGSRHSSSAGVGCAPRSCRARPITQRPVDIGRADLRAGAVARSRSSIPARATATVRPVRALEWEEGGLWPRLPAARADPRARLHTGVRIDQVDSSRASCAARLTPAVRVGHAFERGARLEIVGLVAVDADAHVGTRCGRACTDSRSDARNARNASLSVCGGATYGWTGLVFERVSDYRGRWRARGS
jgi:hypothetical protein